MNETITSFAAKASTKYANKLAWYKIERLSSPVQTSQQTFEISQPLVTGNSFKRNISNHGSTSIVCRYAGYVVDEVNGQ